MTASPLQDLMMRSIFESVGLPPTEKKVLAAIKSADKQTGDRMLEQAQQIYANFDLELKDPR